MVQISGTGRVLYSIFASRYLPNSFRFNEFAHDDRTWKERLQNTILSIPLTLSAELGKPKTSLGRLMKSKEGDIFPMATPENIVIKVAGQSLFHADIGKVGPNAAVSMKQRISQSRKKNG